MSASPSKNDTLYGLGTIARFIGRSEPEARHLADTGQLPTFKLGKLICASKSELRLWRADREGEGIEQ
jgi:hypothetical protein